MAGAAGEDERRVVAGMTGERGGKDGEGGKGRGWRKGEKADMSMGETSTRMCVSKRDLQMGCMAENSTFVAVSKRDLQMR